MSDALARACGGVKAVQGPADGIPHGYSAILVDLADPAAPVVADFYEYPGGRNVHSISTATIDGAGSFVFRPARKAMASKNMPRASLVRPRRWHLALR